MPWSVGEVDVDLDVVASGSGTYDGADALCGTAPTADDAAQISGADTNFQANLAAAFAGVDLHQGWVVDDGANHVGQDSGSGGRQHAWS